MSADLPNNREEDLFEQAAAMPSSEAREAFLLGACGEDSELCGKVQRLLAAHEKAGGFMKTQDQRENGETTLEEIPLTEGSGTVIGRYKLLQKIGEGGMGVVYMAEQTEPVTRKVALKIIKLGMDTRQVVARFEAERQALAMMDHPNIARVLDGGATDTGRPYFVMELVQGIPITEFCDKSKLSAKERIELFIPVCQAIQSAHQKGIIHRDVKPSNVLVTLHHGEPMPKVIDFGIAKAINQKLTEKTLFTKHATMIGTPAYMSPEQAQMTSLDVDTRSDVYSLGVLLYQLLTGTTPFSEKRLRSAGYGEIQRIIAEEEPEKPSTRMSTMVDERKTTVADSRGIDASVLQRLFQGDLDWITMKCLEKDRRRRFETPSELAADLKRYLMNEPVSAAAPTFSYLFKKFHQKHKVVVHSAMIVSTVLLISTIVSATLAVRMNQLRKDAEIAEQSEFDQRATAETERDRATTAEQELLKRSIELEERSVELENNLYLADMLAVEDAVENEDFCRAEQLLLQHRSELSGNDLRGFEWRYYWQQTQGEKLDSFQAHNGAIYKIRIIDNGRHLITSGGDRKIRHWNIADHQLIQEWDYRYLSSFAISPNEQYLCFMEPELGLTIWDLQANLLIRSGGHVDKELSRFVFTHDSRNLVLEARPDPQSEERFFTIEEILTGDEIFTPEGYLLDFAVSPTAPLLWMIRTARYFNIINSFTQVLLSDPSQGYLWNYEQQELIHPPVDSFLFGVAFSPSGAYVAMNDSTPPYNLNSIVNINILRVATGEKISTLQNAFAEHPGGSCSLLLSVKQEAESWISKKTTSSGWYRKIRTRKISTGSVPNWSSPRTNVL